MKTIVIDRTTMRTRMAQLEIITYADLADLAGISRQSIHKMCDVGDFKSGMLDQVAHVLEIDPVDLVTSKDNGVGNG